MEQPIALRTWTLGMTEDRLLVRQDVAPDRTEGGIELPETSKDAPNTGLVLDAGPGRFNEGGVFVKTQLMPGTRVLFAPYTGIEIEGLKVFSEKGNVLRVLRECDVLAVMHEVPPEPVDEPASAS